MKFETKAIHKGYEKPSKNGETAVPIYQSASFAYDEAEDLESVFEGKKFGYVYSRISNPTVTALEQKLTALENGLGSIAVSSGMAAINSIVYALAKKDDEIIVSTSLFGGTYNLFKDLVIPNGIIIHFVNPSNLNQIKEKISPKTRFIFIESIGNPKCDVPNIKLISALAKENYIPLVIDTTLTTPYLCPSKVLGADIVVNAATKYIGTGGTTIGGYVTDLGTFKWKNSRTEHLKSLSKKCGDFAFIAYIRKRILPNTGSCLSPFNAFLFSVGLETLSLRMEKHCENARLLAHYFESHEKIKSTHYPGLKSSPFYEIAKTQFSNRFGGLLTIQMGSKERCYTVLKELNIAKNMTNIGDSRTLVIHPESTLYQDLNEEEKNDAGAYHDLIRISVGLEDSDDLIEDFEQALRKV